MDTAGGVEAGDPAAVRPALAQLAADNLTELQRSVLDAAVSAVRPVWLTVTCGDCGATSRVEAPVPDTRARLQAVELLLREGLGRAPQAEETPASRMPTSIDQVTAMSWDDMCAVFAAEFASELAELRDGDVDLVRHRVAALGDRERQLLHEALVSAAG